MTGRAVSERRLLRDLLRRRGTTRAASPLALGLAHDRFREILGRNDEALETFADLEERLAGHRPVAMELMASRLRRTALDVFTMIKDLNQLSGDEHRELYDVLLGLYGQLEAALGAGHQPEEGPLVLPLAKLRAADARVAGSKLATLGEVRALGERVPDGFVVTTTAFARFLAANDLWARASRLEAILEAEGGRALAEAAIEVQRAIRAAPLPGEVAAAVFEAYDALGGGPVAVRSSAVGEDAAGSSHAGLYCTRLDVGRPGLLDAYRDVVASAFGPTAVAYRLDRGLGGHEAVMGVGCLRMVRPRCAGILFSRPPDDPAADSVIISATAGVGAPIAAGEKGGQMLIATPGGGVATSLLSPVEVEDLVQLGRRLEACFGAPQDVEWAQGEEGLVVLQARPLVAAVSSPSAAIAGAARPLILGGYTACPGVAAGRVFLVRSSADLDALPDGGVLVARFSSPKYARAMRRCAAIVCDVGSPTGHMAILAREYRVPALVGVETATRALVSGQMVTVDATSRCILDGQVEVAHPRAPRPAPAALEHLARVARLVTPLHLTDPAHPGFQPEAARSLHDLTRYVHEKAFEVIFRYGEAAVRRRQGSFRLRARLPLEVRVLDVGGGVATGAGRSGWIEAAEILSHPLRAFLEGLQDPRVPWDQPRPISLRGFLSVVGQSLAAPPPEVQQLGRTSFAIASTHYLNFSARAGYHFSTVDTYCDRGQNKNYVHLRFAGGAADGARRGRRLRFLAIVLGQLGFKVMTRGDLLTATLDKREEALTLGRLADLGRLTLCVRQLDMLMSSDAVADRFAEAFLAGEWERF